MYKVVLIDDERLIVEGLSKVIHWENYGCEIVGTASDGVQGVELIRRAQPDIVITDIRMPNMDGLRMIAAIKSEFPQMQVSVLTAFRDFEYARQAISLGVCRYLLKPSRMPELVEAIEAMTAKLGEIKPQETAEETAESGNFIVRTALAYMQEHCTEHITLSDVAESVYVSQWHLSKLINKNMKQSFLDILAGMRIERAKQLMTDPAKRIRDIAAEVGYTDVAHFSKSFKRIVGKTPGEYRAGLVD